MRKDILVLTLILSGLGVANGIYNRNKGYKNAFDDINKVLKTQIDSKGKIVTELTVQGADTVKYVFTSKGLTLKKK